MFLVALLVRTIGGWLYDTIAGSQGGGIGAFGQALGKAIEGIFQKDWGAMAKGFRLDGQYLNERWTGHLGCSQRNGGVRWC